MGVRVVAGQTLKHPIAGQPCQKVELIDARLPPKVPADLLQCDHVRFQGEDNVGYAIRGKPTVGPDRIMNIVGGCGEGGIDGFAHDGTAEVGLRRRTAAVSPNVISCARSHYARMLPRDFRGLRDLDP